MRILSLYFGHDANCTLFEDGRPVVVLEKERLSRKKHDQGVMDLEAILEQYGWDPGTIDCIAFNPYLRTASDGRRFRWEIEGGTYEKNPDYMAGGWMGPIDNRFSEHRIRLFGRRYKAYAVDHHLAHVAGALFTSPFDRAALLTADGGGDYRMCALAHGNGNKILEIEYGWGYDKPGFQLNIGATWSAIGQHNFGMKRLEGAGKLMGLASYGTPRLELIDALMQQMLRKTDRPFVLSKADSGSENTKDVGLDPEDPFAQDLCASLQKLTTKLYLEAAERMHAWRPYEYLVMTGGCSMNCIANTAVHKSGLFADTWVPAQPHDGGLSLCQALFVWHHIFDRPRIPKALSPYLGTDAGEISDTIIPDIVRFLKDGKSVGLCYGRAESGPRALGHRSILLDPRIPDGKDRLNHHVKHREWFRPFAPMMLGKCEVPSRYMSYIVSADASEVPAVTHVDGTTRPQVVTADGDPFIFKLMGAWRDSTSCSLLLNTSFNCQEPLVDTVAQARATWRRTGLDVLVSPEGVEIDKGNQL